MKKQCMSIFYIIVVILFVGLMILGFKNLSNQNPSNNTEEPSGEISVENTEMKETLTESNAETNAISSQVKSYKGNSYVEDNFMELSSKEDLIAKYEELGLKLDEFANIDFNEYTVLLLTMSISSSSDILTVENVRILNDYVQVEVDIDFTEDIGTCDMGCWHHFIMLRKEDVKNIDLNTNVLY